MAEFDSWNSYWIFAESVRRKARYVFEEQVDKFLKTVLATSEGRNKTIPRDRFLWRAQQGSAWETIRHEEEEWPELMPLPSDKMKPLSRSAREGRVNPKGIPCLYLSNNKETAMSETRPWIGVHVSVGQFKTLKDLILVDCSVEHATNIISHWYDKEPSPIEKEKAVWAHIDKAFSEPVTADESTADYAPTQILAEAFRGHGYDGVIYKSLLRNCLLYTSPSPRD